MNAPKLTLSTAINQILGEQHLLRDTMNPAAIIGKARTGELKPEDSKFGDWAYRMVSRATEQEISLILHGYETYVRSTGSEGSANLLNGTPDPLTEWEFPLLYPTGCPVSGDHTTKWHNGMTGRAVTEYFRPLWASPKVAA